MSDDKLFDDIQRGAQAQALLDNVLLKECFVILDAAYVAAWRQTPVRDTIAREKLWQAVNIVGKVREHLTTVLNNGKLAQADLNFRNAKPQD